VELNRRLPADQQSLLSDYGFNFSLANIEPEIFFTEDKYLKATQEILTKLGSRPGVILLGRGSQMIFKDRKTRCTFAL